jgi:hypothetical protein
MSTAWLATEALAVLGLGGALPSMALAGPRLVTVALAPLAGAVLAGVAAMGCIAVGGTMLSWFVVLAVIVAVVSVAWWWQHRRQDTPIEKPGRAPVTDHVVVGLGLLAVVGMSAWSLRTLRSPTVGFDTRAIWFLHAGWYNEGHTAALAALRNPVLVISHAPYPPLLSAAVALSWRVTGNSSDRLGVVVVALLNACVVMVAAWALVEATRGGLDRLRPTGATGSGLLALLGPVIAGGAVLCAFGVMGPYATNGYADPLWAMAAVGAMAYGLILPCTRRNLGVTLLLIAVAGLTKTEGIYVALALVVLVTVRAFATIRRRAPETRGWLLWRPVVVGLIALFGLGLWPLMTKALHMSKNANTSGVRIGSYLFRAHHTVSSMAPYLHVVLWSIPVAVVGGLFLSPVRRSMALGHDLWAWLAFGMGTALLLGAYVTGPGDVTLWLLTSVDRTTIYPALAAWWILSFWLLVGVGALLDGFEPRSSQSPVSDLRPHESLLTIDDPGESGGHDSAQAARIEVQHGR